MMNILWWVFYVLMNNLQVEKLWNKNGSVDIVSIIPERWPKFPNTPPGNKRPLPKSENAIGLIGIFL